MTDRKLVDVLDNMIDLVPSHEDVLVTELRRIRSSAAYCSPEMLGQWWSHTANFLWGWFGDEPPTQGWEFEVWKEWMGPTWEEYVDA